MINIVLFLSKLIKKLDHSFHIIAGIVLKKKYILTKDKRALYLRDLPRSSFSSKLSVPAGTIGGYLDSEYNLSQIGNCVVLDNARVTENSVVKDDAIVKGVSVLKDSVVDKYAEISGSFVTNCEVSGITYIQSSDVKKVSLDRGNYLDLELEFPLNSYIYDVLKINEDTLFILKDKFVWKEDIFVFPNNVNTDSSLEKAKYVIQFIEESRNEVHKREVSP